MRTYNFQLPYTISGMEVSFGLNELKQQGLFERLPQDLQERFQAAADNWQGVEVTEAECNEIDDQTWAAIANMLGLSWSE